MMIKMMITIIRLEIIFVRRISSNVENNNDLQDIQINDIKNSNNMPRNIK